MSCLVTTFGADLVVGQRVKVFNNDTPRLGVTSLSAADYEGHLAVVKRESMTRAEPEGREQERDQSVSSVIASDFDQEQEDDVGAILEDDLADERWSPTSEVYSDKVDDETLVPLEEIVRTTPQQPQPLRSALPPRKVMTIANLPENAASSKQAEKPNKALKLGSKMTAAERKQQEIQNQGRKLSEQLEFDLASIKITAKKDEVDDLFSQMEPTVKFNKNKSSNKPKSSSMETSVSRSQSKTNLFVCNQTDDDINGGGEGWGDEDDDIHVESE